jgi:hypothetical protein
MFTIAKLKDGVCFGIGINKDKFEIFFALWVMKFIWGVR